MLQHTEIVFTNEIDFADGSIACLMDPLVLTTYVGDHVIGCQVTMLGEDHGTSVVVPRSHVRGMSDLNVLHQDVVAAFLRYDDVTCIDLDYQDYDRFVSER